MLRPERESRGGKVPAEDREDYPDASLILNAVKRARLELVGVGMGLGCWRAMIPCSLGPRALKALTKVTASHVSSLNDRPIGLTWPFVHRKADVDGQLLAMAVKGLWRKG